MIVKVLFFGATADVVGGREMEVELADGVRASDALTVITRQFPALTRHSLLFAVNQEYAKGDEVIGESDELAVFTAVSGG